MTWEEDTKEHISKVQKILQHLNRELSLRGIAHDRSKLEPPEAEYFKEYTPLLEDVTYGSPEYEQFLKEMKPGLDHHYQNNRHHPEHFENGIADMNLIDLIEMLADWKAASMRHEDGDLVASIEKNAERFEIDPQLVQIFKNTILVLDEAFKEE